MRIQSVPRKIHITSPRLIESVHYGILNTRKHNVSKVGSVSVFREGDAYSIGSLKMLTFAVELVKVITLERGKIPLCTLERRLC
jgi:hypothetical protein